MKRVLSVLLTVIMLVLVYKNSYINEVPKIVHAQVKAIDTITFPDYSVLYTCHDDTNKDSCLEVTIQDAELLMKIARQEGGPTLDGQLWAMRVIYNRLADGNFGASVWDVVSSNGQFEVFTNGSYINAEVNSNSHMALAMLESGWDETQGALYWRTDAGSKNSWHERKLTYIATVDGNRYYR